MVYCIWFVSVFGVSTPCLLAYVTSSLSRPGHTAVSPRHQPVLHSLTRTFSVFKSLPLLNVFYTVSSFEAITPAGSQPSPWYLQTEVMVRWGSGMRHPPTHDHVEVLLLEVALKLTS